MENSYLDLVLFSEKRKKILLLLSEGPKSLEEIKSFFDAGPTSVQPQIKLLKDKYLLYQEDNKYKLTPVGEIIVESLQNMINTIETFESKQEFWNSHKLDGIPLHLLKRISDLKCSTFARPLDEANIFSPHKEFVENITKSEFVKGVSPFIHPLYPKMFLNFAQKGISISLIVTEAVFNRMKTEFRHEVGEFLALNNTHIYVYDKEMLLSSVVTDRFLSLGLFYINGVYDHVNDVISFDPKALQWGEDLYAYYKGLSREVKEI
ncbi:MAG TPA: winged helix-turn-helix domain-containing protein [Methanosarcina sp.]|nr:winged helix-turn-helix domain-containing protein [Methanosarcina sp.]